MDDTFIVFLTDLFFSLEKKGSDGYLLVKLSVPCKCLLLLYDKLETAEIMPIDMIAEDDKLRYWNIAKKYYQSKDDRIKASKAAYALSLITSS